MVRNASPEYAQSDARTKIRSPVVPLKVMLAFCPGDPVDTETGAPALDGDTEYDLVSCAMAGT